MTADAAFWNVLAEKYSKQPVADPAAFERKIAITMSLMTPSDVVLDIGCGTGSLALRLAPSAAQLHGLDSFTTFQAGSLRGICAYSLLHLVDDLPAALARIFHLLAPGGFFVSSTVCLGESRVPYRPLLWLLRRLGKAPMVKILSKLTHQRPRALQVMVN